MSEDFESEVLRTDFCEECDREITAEVEMVEGRDELIHKARTAEEGFMSVTAGKAVITFGCSCDYVRVEYGPGSASAWDFPDSWMWEDEIDTEEALN